MAGQRMQRGQSLVEVVVLAAALVPLLLAVPLIAKYQDLRHAAIAASRSAAFECSVRPEECMAEAPAMWARLAGNLHRRHFARHDRDLLSNDAMADDPVAGERNRFWVDRHGASLLAAASDVAIAVQSAELDAARSAWGRASGPGASESGSSAVIGLTAAAPAAFGLALGQGLVTAGVQARVSLHRTLADWLQAPEGIALRLSGRTAVMVDAWNASSGKGEESRSFQSRLQRGWRLPAPGVEEAIDAAYAPVKALIGGPLMAPVEPRGSLFRYHEIDVDVVPADRLAQP
jgi:hypothetical protein